MSSVLNETNTTNVTVKVSNLVPKYISARARLGKEKQRVKPDTKESLSKHESETSIKEKRTTSFLRLHLNDSTPFNLSNVGEF